MTETVVCNEALQCLSIIVASISAYSWRIAGLCLSIWDMDRQTQQLMRLVRLMRTLRLAKASRLIFRLTKRVTLNTGIIEFFKWVVYELVIAHRAGATLVVLESLPFAALPRC